MGTGAEIAAYAALATTAASSYMQYEASQDVARKQKEAGKAKTAAQLQADLAAKRQAIREHRVRVARIQQAAENAGVQGSSGESGAVGAVGQNMAISTAFQTGQQSASMGISRTLQKAADAQSEGNKWAAIGTISNSIFGATGSSLFADKAPKQVSTNIQHQPLPDSIKNTNPYTNASIFDTPGLS